MGTRRPAERNGSPDDVAAVLFLCAGPAFITGQVLRVDGGNSLAITGRLGRGRRSSSSGARENSACSARSCPRERQHHLRAAGTASATAPGFGPERRPRRGLDRVGHLEDVQALPVRVGEAMGDPVGAHRVQQDGVVDDLLLRVAGADSKRVRPRKSRAPSRGGTPSEDRKISVRLRWPIRETHFSWPENTASRKSRSASRPASPCRDGLGGRNHPLDVAVIGDAVEADREGPDVLLDPSARFGLHEGILAA